MGKFYAGYQLLQVLEDGVGPSKNIWQFDGSRRVFFLDYGSESMRGHVYLNSGPSLAGYTRYVPNAPIEPEDHIPEILAIFAPQLFISKTKYEKLTSQLIKLDSGDKKSTPSLLDLDVHKTPGILNDFIHEIEEKIELKMLSSVLSQAEFRSNDGKKWVMYCTIFNQRD